MNERKSARKHRGQAGFTLVEIMIVLAIVGVLFSFVGVNVIEKFRESKEKAASIQIANFEQALQAYYLDNNRYPNTAQGLDSLVNKPSVGKEPKNYSNRGYLGKKTVPKDPWGNDYRYACEDYQDYSICSNGPDEESGSEDDICSEE